MAEDEFTVEDFPGGQIRTYPNGRKVLVQSSSALAEQLESKEPALKAATQAMREAQAQVIEDKLAALDDGTSVPHEKRSL